MGATLKSTNESREILDDIRRLVQAIRLASGQSEKSMKLSAAQLFVLSKLRDEKGLSINDLAERTLTHQSSVSVIVQKLEAKKLIVRSVAPEDARKFSVSLTRKGAALMRRAPESIQDKLIAALMKMQPIQRRQFATTFGEFLRNANIKGRPPMMFDDPPKQKKS